MTTINLHERAQSFGFGDIVVDETAVGSTGYLDNVPATTPTGCFIDKHGRKAVVLKITDTEGFVLFERYRGEGSLVVSSPIGMHRPPFDSGAVKPDQIEEYMKAIYLINLDDDLKALAAFNATTAFEVALALAMDSEETYLAHTEPEIINRIASNIDGNYALGADIYNLDEEHDRRPFAIENGVVVVAEPNESGSTTPLCTFIGDRFVLKTDTVLAAKIVAALLTL